MGHSTRNAYGMVMALRTGGQKQPADGNLSLVGEELAMMSWPETSEGLNA